MNARQARMNGATPETMQQANGELTESQLTMLFTLFGLQGRRPNQHGGWTYYDGRGNATTQSQNGNGEQVFQSGNGQRVTLKQNPNGDWVFKRT